MKVVVCNDAINELLHVTPMTYQQGLSRALIKDEIK
jgi:hypothetical protein